MSLILLTGCGVGGAGGSGDGSSGGPATADVQARAALMGAIGSKWDSLPHTSRADDAQAMLDFLKARSDVTDAGVAPDLCISATAPDGATLVIVNNDLPDTGTAAAAPSSAKPTVANREIPAGSTVRMAYMFGPAAQNPWFQTQNYGPGLSAIMDVPGGYDVSTGNLGGAIGVLLDDLRLRIGGDGSKVTALFTGGHGGLASHRDGAVLNYFLLTDQQVPTTTGPPDDQVQFDYQAEREDSALWHDIYDQTDDSTNSRVVFGYANYQGTDGKLHTRWNYGITAQFVKQYFDFAPNSIWYNASCSGYVDPGFRIAAYGKGLSVYGGWDAEAQIPIVTQGGLYLFDRLGGANLQAPQDPPNRPFDWQAVFAAIQSAHRDLSLVLEGGKPIIAHLHFDQGPVDDFGLLAPSITHGLVQESTGRLELSGDFGSGANVAPGTVYLSGQALTGQTNWITPNLITIKDIPADAVGDLYVVVGGHKSNVIQLTQWSGQLTYKVLTGSLNPYDLEVDFTMDVSFRGDPHQFRGAVDQAPDQGGGAAMTNMKVSSCTFKAFGTDAYTYPDGTKVTETWSGSGSVPSQLDAGQTGDNHFGASLSVDKTTLTGRLGVVAYSNQIKRHVVSQPPVGPPAVTDDTISIGFSTGSQPVNVKFDSSLNVTTDGSPNVQDDGAIKATLIWGTLSATHAPTSSTPG